MRLSLESIPRPKFIDNKGRTTIWAHVDDSDYLLLTPEGLQWEYGGRWARVGMHEGVFPTLVNGIAWWPEWTDPVRSGLLKTNEFKAAADGKQTVSVTDIVARHGLVEAEAAYDGVIRVRFRDMELGSGDIGCTLAFSGTSGVARRLSGSSPAQEAVSARDLDTVCETLAAKKKIEGSAGGSIASIPPRGNGRYAMIRSGGSIWSWSTMNRRSACICFVALLKTAILSPFAQAAQEAARSISRIAGPRWNVNGDWTPSIEEIQSHLRDAHGIDPSGRDMEDLLNLHDNDHNRMGYRTGHGHKKAAKSSTKGYAKH